MSSSSSSPIFKTLKSQIQSSPMAKTHIILLIDLHPLTHIPNPSSYLNSIFNSSKSLLTSPNLYKSKSSFKLFFSSLSPSLSQHHVKSQSNSFASSTQTLISLSEALNSITINTQLKLSAPRGAHVAGSLFRVVQDCNWERKKENPYGNFCDLIEFRSNLVFLFSPVGKLDNWVFEFVNGDEDSDEKSELFGNVELFGDRFRDVFRSVNDACVRRDIHVSWIDVVFDEEKDVLVESSKSLQVLKSGIRGLGWGFCSTDSIILGSALIPFDLIYPLFGVTSNYLHSIENCKPMRTQLALEILGVEGKPLESNLCNLELFSLNKQQTPSVSDVIKSLRLGDVEKEAPKDEEIIYSAFDSRIAKIQIKSVHKCSEDATDNRLSNLIFVRGDYSKEARKSSKESVSSFFADKVLEAVSGDNSEFSCSKNGPVWQILLSFLSRNGCEALVSIITEKGEPLMAILKPFTVHIAFLTIINDKHNKDAGFKSPKSETLPSRNSSSFMDQNKNRKRKNVYKDLTWTSFRKEAFEFTTLELEEAYFAGKFSISKKLKFLKCWMKQVSNSFFVQVNAESAQPIERGTDVRLLGTGDDTQQSNHSGFPTEPSRVQDLAASESFEAFFNDLPKKIQHGLESEGVDLQILAERLVNLSIYWLSQKSDTCNSFDNKNPEVTPEESHGNIVSDLIKLLIKEPKELKDKLKDNGYVGSASETIVREHELQIFLRMEILRSKVSGIIEASRKRKFVKQICALLEIIQYLVDGGFHGNITLYGYIESTIKTRYFHVLEDVVNKIYKRMDLLPFGDEEHSPILVLNSEDSNHSWRDISRNVLTGDNYSSSGENEFSKSEVDCLQDDISKDENSRKVSGVNSRRDKASRCLLRVWAPKQQGKGIPVKSEGTSKRLKRKERSKRKKDVVCETPESDKKHNGDNRVGSCSKALFQDE